MQNNSIFCFILPRRSWKWLVLTIALGPLLGNKLCQADSLEMKEIKLPPLQLSGKPASAHTQGLEVVEDKFFVTARRDDVRPRRALLLRTGVSERHWDFWDITPIDPTGGASGLDHPGGMQSDGKRLWIPIAESKPKSRSIIRVFPVTAMVAGAPLKAEFEFPFNDHIGALAVATDHGLVFGANWDTEVVYVWDMKGHLTRTLTGQEVRIRGLGIAGLDKSAGVAIQDWKAMGDRLFASGLSKTPASGPISSRSQFVSFTGFSEANFQRKPVALPLYEGIELAREAMTISDGFVYFLPQDLGESNRLFKVPFRILAGTSGD